VTLTIQDKKFSGFNVNAGYPYTNHICIATTRWNGIITYITGLDESESSNKTINTYSPESTDPGLFDPFMPLCVLETVLKRLHNDWALLGLVFTAKLIDVSKENIDGKGELCIPFGPISL